MDVDLVPLDVMGNEELTPQQRLDMIKALMARLQVCGWVMCRHVRGRRQNTSRVGALCPGFLPYFGR